MRSQNSFVWLTGGIVLCLVKLSVLSGRHFVSGVVRICCKDLGGWSEKEEEPDALVQERITKL